MVNNNLNVYYIDLNNIFDKNEVLDILKTKYSDLDGNENLWIFYRGFYFGSNESAYKMINKKKF